MPSVERIDRAVATTPVQDKERLRAVDLAVGQIEKQFGKGSIMRLGQKGAIQPIDAIPTGAISIDYALMERTDSAFVVPGRFEWDDIGDWAALERLVQGDGTNTVVGRHVGHDASGNIVYTEEDSDVVVTLGVHDLVVVKRGHMVLLVHKDRVQEIKTLLEDERLAGLLAEKA